MAKLKGPLMSLGASGKLANTLVFFGWKGLNVVREYVVLSNPDTTAQGVQRDLLKAAVAMIHTAMADADNPLNSADQVAYSALAQAKGKIMTWFNMACKLWIDTSVAVEVPIIYSDCRLATLTPATFRIFIYLNEGVPSSLTHGKFYFGTSKTNLIHSYDAEIDLGVSAAIATEDLSAFLTAGKKYFVQFRPDADKPCEGADSGIYNFVAE